MYGYGKLAQLLAELTKKDSFCWGTNPLSVFEALKEALTFAPILALLDFYEIEYNGCDKGIGVVLM